MRTTAPFGWNTAKVRLGRKPRWGGATQWLAVLKRFPCWQKPNYPLLIQMTEALRSLQLLGLKRTP